MVVNIQIKSWPFGSTIREKHLPFDLLFLLFLTPPKKKVEKSKRRDLRCIEPHLGWLKPLTEVPPCSQLQASPGRTCLAIQSASRLSETNEDIESLSKETEVMRKSQMQNLELKNTITETKN